jgi:cysteine desulfuration protein SufE
MTIKEKQQELIDEFAFLDDWEQKYEYIIDLGKELKGLSEEKKTDENLIRGCQSKVWIDAGSRMANCFSMQILTGFCPKELFHFW